MQRDDREAAMRKTILGFIAVIFCGVLLMPLLVDTAPPSASVARPVGQQIAKADLVRQR
jgi:hypothetical protein